MSMTYEQERTEGQRIVDAEVKENVLRGLAWLEKTHGPGWEDKIDLATLDLRYGQNCVLGQVYGRDDGFFDEDGKSYISGYHYAGEKFFKLGAGDDCDELYYHGFTLPRDSELSCDAAWRDLTDEWRNVLTPRVQERS